MTSPGADQSQIIPQPQPTLARRVTFRETLLYDDTISTLSPQQYDDVISQLRAKQHSDENGIELGIFKRARSTTSESREPLDEDDGKIWGLRKRTVMILSLIAALLLGGLLGGIAGGLLAQKSVAASPPAASASSS